MYKNYEVLSFSVSFKTKDVYLIKKLKHFDKAPHGVLHHKGSIDDALSSYFLRRKIAEQRYDYQKILDATGCEDSFELSFKGHGLSLTNHYWFRKEDEKLRYEDINFFTNKWDDSFARAVLTKDYEALKKCSLEVPDIVTPGWSLKGWIYDNGPKLYKMSRSEDDWEECLGEVLGSRLGRRLLGDEAVLTYELKMIGGQYASVSPAMINIDEELIPFSSYMPYDVGRLYFLKSHNKALDKEFYDKLNELKLDDLYELFVKINCVKSLSFLSDLHFDNLSVIKNEKTGQVRFAPLYDLASSFGTGKKGKSFVSNLNKGSYLIMLYFFANLDPSWDYSWYDPHKLDGFEDEIRDILTKSDFYTPEILDRILEIYRYQKASLDKISKKL